MSQLFTFRNWKFITNLIIKQSDQVFKKSLETVNKNIFDKVQITFKKVYKIYRANPRVKFQHLHKHKSLNKSESMLIGMLILV